jgi:hypothetical protein
MMRATTLAGIIVIVCSPPVAAQSVDRATDGLEACFRQARLADKICEALTVPGERLDCFKNTRDAQLECLTHTLPDERTTSTVPSGPSSPPSASPKETESNQPENTGSSEPTKLSRDAGSEPGSSKADAGPDSSGKSAAGSEAAVAVRSSPQTITKAGPAPPANNWIVSETTSPVDYSPLVTAVMQATQPGDNGPSSLTIRCRAKRTELLLQFAGNPASPRPGEPQIHFQVEDQSPVKQDWNWSRDAKIATLKNDAVTLLQFLPEGARLTIWTGLSTQQGSAFQLAGLGAIRKKVAAACNWPPQQAQTSIKKK